MLVLRFVDYDGVETILPLGEGMEWNAPNHGVISVRINDMTFYDNKYKVESGLQHHTGVTYAPAQ